MKRNLVTWASVFGIAHVCLGQAGGACDLVYYQDFSTNPYWTTDDPAKLRWDSGAGTFHGVQVNTEGTYAYINLPGFDPNKPWRLEVDSRMNADDWSAGWDFGLMDTQLRYPLHAGLGMGIADRGRYTVLWGKDGVFSPGWEYGVWYHNVLEFNPATQQLTLSITNRATGQQFIRQTRTVASFPSNTTRLGVTRLHMKNTGPGAAPYGRSDYELDNISLCQVGGGGGGDCRALYEFDEASGTTALDSCGIWNGTLLNGATRAAGSPYGGSALLLDGVNDYVSIASGMLLNLPQGTVEAYVYRNAEGPILRKGNPSLTDFILTVTSDGTLVVHMGTPLYFESKGKVPLRTWTKVALTWDGTYWKLYINDALDKEQATMAVPLNNANPVEIGHHQNGVGTHFYFGGQIDHVRVSTVAKTFKSVF